MKKLISILSTFTLSSSAVLSVVSCLNNSEELDDYIDSNEAGNKVLPPQVSNLFNHKNYDYDKGNDSSLADLNKHFQSRTLLSDQILANDFSNKEKFKKARSEALRKRTTMATNVTKSTLAKTIIDNKKRNLTYKPYADIGIVEDNVEYLLKWKSLGGAYRDEALNSIEKRGGKRVNYNDLAEIKKNNIAKHFVLGFMQNDWSTNELVPAWNATPVKENGAGDWYQQRLEKWKKDGLNPEDLTISFGPFANAFWHTAYKNNYTEFDLADRLEKLSDKYGTKSYDFYFAAPYNSHTGEYAEAIKLLAGALKVLLDRDKSYKIRLSMIVGRDGFTVPGGFNGSPKLVGDEMYPLYEFTRYLGLNFTLNLVSGYLTPPTTNSENNSSWVVDQTKNALKNTYDTWSQLLNYFTDRTDITEDLIYNRIAITPWIGRRAEVGQYKFTAEDAFEIRKLAEEKGLESISMFYISRDNPSEFMSNGLSGSSLADLNPLDQNLRSGVGYEQYTFSKIFNGNYNKEDIPQEALGANIKSLKGYVDYESWFNQNTDLDEYASEGLGEWDGVASGETAVADPTVPSKSKYLTWYDANPTRIDKQGKPVHVAKKGNANKHTYFSPYLDAGLWSGNRIDQLLDGKVEERYRDEKDNNKPFINKSNNFSHLTLSFVQQVNTNDHSLELSVAGIKTGTADYEYWQQNQLKKLVLQPLKEKGLFKNLKVAYGGFATGDNGRNPWEFLYKKHNKNIESAAQELKDAMIKFNKDLASLVGASDYPKSLDFDIEGHAQSKTEEIKVLARALVLMKNEDPNWDFSVTLPVLPSGLTTAGKGVVKVFTDVFNKAGLGAKELPVVNLMTMDYGNPIYDQAIRAGASNFILARDAVNATKENLKEIIKQSYGDMKLTEPELYKLLAATPMIGVNDTVSGVFTLEDAKELYNWAHYVGLNYIGMWSLNDDNSTNGHNPSIKTTTNHGLNYLREWDFVRAFTGEWTNWVLTPDLDPWKIRDN